MPPTINNSPVKDLLKNEIQQYLQVELDNFHNLLLGSLARISCLEKEVDDLRGQAEAQATTPIAQSSRSSATSSPPIQRSNSICRHWLRNRCSYNQICRFKHEMDIQQPEKKQTCSKPNDQNFGSAGSDDRDGSNKDNSNNDVDKVNSTSFWPNIQSVLLPKPLKTSSEESRYPSSPAVPTMSAKVHKRIVSAAQPASKEDDPEFGAASAAAAFHKSNQSAAITQDTFCPETLASKIDQIQKKYTNSYKPKTVNGITYSANVYTPSIDFAKIRPHLYRNLPKPENFAIHGCSQKPDFYLLCTESTPFRQNKVPKFETEFPFGSAPGFLSNLGITGVPTVPIGGYIYDGGAGQNTSYVLYAEPSYKT